MAELLLPDTCNDGCPVVPANDTLHKFPVLEELHKDPQPLPGPLGPGPRPQSKLPLATLLPNALPVGVHAS